VALTSHRLAMISMASRRPSKYSTAICRRISSHVVPSRSGVARLHRAFADFPQGTLLDQHQSWAIVPSQLARIGPYQTGDELHVAVLG